MLSLWLNHQDSMKAIANFMMLHPHGQKQSLKTRRIIYDIRIIFYSGKKWLAHVPFSLLIIMQITELKKKLDERLAKQFSPRVLLDNLRLIDEASRKTSAYTDPLYLPCYYHLGALIQPKNIIDIGFRLGLFSSCFLKSCKTVKHIFGFQEKTEEYYSCRLGKANVLQIAKKVKIDIHVGTTLDEEFITKLHGNKWELCFINQEAGYDKHMSYLDLVWPQMELDGFIVMDYITRHQPAKRAFFDFCKSKNREPVAFQTRYGLGIIQR